MHSSVVFVSLFLGIVTGQQTIEVATSEDVAAVRFMVDGEIVGESDERPWRIFHDFGPELTTHALEAVALDKAGQEVGRAVQHLNVPRPRVQAEVLLEEWVEGSPTVARVLWHSAQALEPQRASVSIDGIALDISDLNRVDLPALDPNELHFINAEIVFGDREVASAEVIFGGAYGSSVETELTALPLIGRKRGLESLEDTSGWLRHANGTELPIVAVDEGPAEVAVIREDLAMLPLAEMDGRMRLAPDISYKRLRLERRDRLRFVSAKPSSTVHPTMRYEIFPVSRAYSPRDGALPRLLSGVLFTGDDTPAQRITDAIAIAGRFVVESQKRRAVLVVTRNCANVSGRYSSDAVRSYLAELHVPLRVWQVGRVRSDVRRSGLCETAEEIYSPRKYGAAVRRLRESLAKQQIVWVQGRPLPREITLTASARGIQLVGR